MSSELGVRRNRRRPQKTQIISATEPAILGCTNDDDVLISVDGIDGEAVDVVLRNFPLRKFLWGARSMGVPQLARSIVVICSAALSCACAYSPDTIDRTVSYNEAVANSNNEILLLNIVRASQRYPTYYSRLEANTSVGTLTPQLQLSLSLSHGRQITSSATGASSQLTNAAMSLMPQLQAVETNQLQLQSLDDQKYIEGMMTPVSSKLYSYFLSAGWSPELLGSMFIEEIDIDANYVSDIRKAVAKACPQDNNTSLCKAINGTDNSENHPSLDVCLPFSTSNPSFSYRFQNDPAAIDVRSDDHPNPHCFQYVLRALLVLNLTPSTTVPAKPPTIVQSGLPSSFATASWFIESLLKNDEAYSIDNNGKLAVCKFGSSPAPSAGSSANSSSTPSSDNSDNTPAEFDLPGLQSDSKAGNKDAAESRDQTLLCDNAVNPTASPTPDQEITKPEYNAGIYSMLLPGSSTSDSNKSVNIKIPHATSHGRRSAQKTPSTGRTKIATLTLRSPEGMIYYLAQIARVSSSNSAARLPETANGTIIFSVLSGTTTGKSALSVEFKGQTYYIPNVCDGAGCVHDIAKIEKPNYWSLDVLSLVNQMWGLQKEASSMPAAPAVTVINP
ncbi:MAG: hypothetical protein WCA81_12315 [Rhizomicrobium sp.]